MPNLRSFQHTPGQGADRMAHATMTPQQINNREAVLANFPPGLRGKPLNEWRKNIAEWHSAVTDEPPEQAKDRSSLGLLSRATTRLQLLSLHDQSQRQKPLRRVDAVASERPWEQSMFSITKKENNDDKSPGHHLMNAMSSELTSPHSMAAPESQRPVSVEQLQTHHKSSNRFMSVTDEQMQMMLDEQLEKKTLLMSSYQQQQQGYTRSRYTTFEPPPIIKTEQSRVPWHGSISRHSTAWNESRIVDQAIVQQLQGHRGESESDPNDNSAALAPAGIGSTLDLPYPLPWVVDHVPDHAKDQPDLQGIDTSWLAKGRKNPWTANISRIGMGRTTYMHEPPTHSTYFSGILIADVGIPAAIHRLLPKNIEEPGPPTAAFDEKRGAEWKLAKVLVLTKKEEEAQLQQLETLLRAQKLQAESDPTRSIAVDNQKMKGDRQFTNYHSIGAAIMPLRGLSMVSHTISQDRTGDQDEVCQKLLAAQNTSQTKPFLSQLSQSQQEVRWHF